MERDSLQLYGTIQDVKNNSLGAMAWFCLEAEGYFFLSKWHLNLALKDEQEGPGKNIYSGNSKYDPRSQDLEEHKERGVADRVREEKRGTGGAGELCRVLGYASCFSDELEGAEIVRRVWLLTKHEARHRDPQSPSEEGGLGVLGCAATSAEPSCLTQQFIWWWSQGPLVEESQ